MGAAPYTDRRGSDLGGRVLGAPSMGAVLRVQVPPKGDHPDRSKPQLQKGDRLWGGSGERNRESMYKNQIRGDVERGEQAQGCEAPMVKAQAA